MAVTFLETKKRQRYFMLASLLVILITAFVVWQGFFKEEGITAPEVLIDNSASKININFKLLEEGVLDKFEPFEEIPPFEGELGRENPFLPQ